MNISKIKNSITQTSVRHVWGCIYICVLMVCVSFYFTQGYLDIGEDKYRAFFCISVVAVPMWMMFSVVSIIRNRAWNKINAHLGTKEYFVMFFVLAAIITTLTSEYRTASIWGFEGWHMGLIVQLLMVGLYLISRDIFQNISLKAGKNLITFLLGVAGIVFILGLLNRFSIFPIHMKGEAEDFISTLGNINWYSGYWCIWYGLVCGVFLKAREKKIRIVTGIFVWFGAVAGICSGSSSAYLVFMAIIFTSFVINLISSETILRWTQMVFLQILCFPTIRLIGLFRKNRMWYDSSLLKGLCYGNIWVIPFIIGLIICFGIGALSLISKKDYGRFRGPVVGAAGGILLAIVLLIILNSCVDGGIWPIRGVGLFTWNKEWGNGRGGIWTFTIQMIGKMDPFKMFFGYGCDCYYYFVYYETDIAWKMARFMSGQYLANAHNELLNMFVNEGIFGVIAYTGLIFSYGKAGIDALSNECSGDSYKESIILGCILAGCGYVAIGTVGFMQILSTPFFFMVCGIMAGVMDKKTQSTYNYEKCERN